MMRRVRVFSIKNQRDIAEKCEVADSFGSRLVGLIGRMGLGPGEGLYFPRCQSIHMWMMKFRIDVVFIKRTSAQTPFRFSVSSVHESVRPWKPFPIFDFRAEDVLELPEGTIQAHSLAVHDELEIRDV